MPFSGRFFEVPTSLAVFTNSLQRGPEIRVPALLGFHGNEAA
jgi:hypothetical protein